MKRADQRRPIINSLVVYSRKVLKEWGSFSTNNKLTTTHANAFLLGVMFDKFITADRAWEAGEWINDSLGDPGDIGSLWKELKTIEKRRLIGFSVMVAEEVRSLCFTSRLLISCLKLQVLF